MSAVGWFNGQLSHLSKIPLESLSPLPGVTSFGSEQVHVCVCVCLLEGYLLAKAFGSWTSFSSTIQCVVTMVAFLPEVVGMSVGSGFPVLSSRGWLVK